MAKQKQLPAVAPLPASPVMAPGEHVANFLSEYANNIRFEPTVYDLKLVFGETDISGGKETIKQHSSVTIPWALAKVGLYYLEVNLAIHEMVNGKVTIPTNQIPAPATPVPPEMSDDPHAHKAKEIVTKLRQKFLDSL